MNARMPARPSPSSAKTSDQKKKTMADSATSDISNRLRWVALGQRAIDRCSSEARKVSGLSLTQSRALFHLAVYPGKRTASVATSLNLLMTTAASALDVICSKGYARKQRAESGTGRGMEFFLTDEGYAQLPLYIAGFEKVFAELAQAVGAEAFDETLRAMLPNGTISMVETCVDDTTLRPNDIYKRLEVPQAADPKSALFDKAMYVEKIAWSLEEIDRHDSAGVNRKERLVLRALADLRGESEVRVLRDRLLMKPPTASGALRGLQKRGYVSRIDDPDNRRVVIASLTDAGSEVERRSRPGFEAVFDECFPGFADRKPPIIR